MATLEEGSFSARDGIQLRWQRMAAQGGRGADERPRAQVGLIHGYMDHQGRWAEVAGWLAGLGFEVSSYDFRGHGKSEGPRGHCDRFEDYVDDLDRFWTRMRDGSGSDKAFLIAHSHGGLTALRWVAQRHPEGLAGLVLVNPFTEFAFKPPALKVGVSKAVGKLVPWLPVKHPLKPEDLTRDPEAQRRVREDPLYTRVATPRWFTECVRAQAEARAQAKDVGVPTLMLLSGSDRIADPVTNRQLFEGLGAEDKVLREYPEAMHELLNDLDKEEAEQAIASWISSHL